MDKMNINEEKKPEKWTNNYWNQINRNIGFITFDEQEKLKNTPIAILGIGGIGGPLAEQLIRIGCEKIVICDYDKFIESNLNRQICTREDVGKYKIDVLKNFLEKINPEVKITTFYEINEVNISEVLKNIQVVALTLDDPVASILISRECNKNQIPMIESWAFPLLCAWWFTKKSIDYESFYGFNTHNKTIQQINDSEEIRLRIYNSLIDKLFQFPGLKEWCDREPGALKGMISRKLPFRSFAPMVRLTASYLAFEIVYTAILKVKKMIIAPYIIGYDYYLMKPLEFSFF